MFLVLVPRGWYCLAIVHPLAESGRFVENGSFLVDRSYLGTWRYPGQLSRRGIEMTFHTEHRPIEQYARALEQAGFVIERLREPMPDDREAGADPQRSDGGGYPNFLMLRARSDRSSS